MTESLNLNTSVVAITTSGAPKQDSDLKLQEALDNIDDAIAVATSSLGLLPGVAFQARVLQLAHLSNAHKSVSHLVMFCMIDWFVLAATI